MSPGLSAQCQDKVKEALGSHSRLILAGLIPPEMTTSSTLLQEASEAYRGQACSALG